jgi:hypothetical protein
MDIITPIHRTETKKVSGKVFLQIFEKQEEKKKKKPVKGDSWQMVGKICF